MKKKYNKIAKELEKMANNILKQQKKLTDINDQFINNNYWDNVPKDFSKHFAETMFQFKLFLAYAPDIIYGDSNKINEEAAYYLQTWDKIFLELSEEWQRIWYYEVIKKNHESECFKLLETVYKIGKDGSNSLVKVGELGNRLMALAKSDTY